LGTRWSRRRSFLLGWPCQPAVAPLRALALATCQMVAAFSRTDRAVVPVSSQIRPASSMVVTLLRLGLTAAAWDRILDELVASGLLRATFASLSELVP